ARANKVKRFVYASTSSVYGIKSEKNVAEEASLEPLTDYSKFKAECERVLQEKGDNVEWVIIRPATVCGYAPRLRLDVVVNILTINALINKKIKIFGGGQLRPNINIKDMVKAYELLLEAPSEKINRQIFNAGYQNLSVAEIANIVKRLCGDEVVLEIVPTNDKRSYHINSDKIKKVLGFTPQFTVEEAVQSLIRAFKEGLIKDGLNNSAYYNIKRMQELKLK
ncbi:MAG: SDR family oxidoreductase, partial [Nanoarchaeota archaeon]